MTTNDSQAPSDESHHERELGGQLLASVSRSFYLTLKALPRELREPISLAYLLARTADTLADTAAVPAEVRLDTLRRYQGLIEAEAPKEEQELHDLIRVRFLPLQSDDAERRLMERFPDGLAWLRTIRGAPLEAIQGVLRPIIRGQQLDIERFPGDGDLRSLQNPDELHDYTWLVAGCVGEFWTDMCASEKPGALDATVAVSQMKDWGARMGKGLQIINILRDLGEDIDDGRCYLPQSQWGAAGLDLGMVKAKSAGLRPIWETWLGICREHLECGLLYVQHVADGKLRYATALPLLLGIRTLGRMERASWPQLLAGVKISRMDVALILAEAAVAARSPEKVERLYRKLAR